MIYGDVYLIGIQLELVGIYSNCKCGIFNFIIDEKLVPGAGVNLDFFQIIETLKKSLDYGLNKNMPDIGAIPLEQLDFSGEVPFGIIALDADPLYDYGCCFSLGFDRDEDRLFYTTDYEKTMQEKRFPRGTIERLIRNLPKYDEIEFCGKNS